MIRLGSRTLWQIKGGQVELTGNLSIVADWILEHQR